MSTEEALFGIRHNEAANDLWRSEQMFRWSFMLRPSLSIDGNQWCALHGENLQDGVAGFGDSPDAAYAAFDIAWTEKLSNGARRNAAAIPPREGPLQSTTEQAGASRDHPVREIGTVGWAILQALHEGVEDGPQSWSDLADDQEKRIKKAAVAAIETVTDLAQFTAQGFSLPTPPREGVEREAITEEQIKHMADRFLGWHLPENFNPDAGISFARLSYQRSADTMPSGTNLLDADQAIAMVRYVVEGMPT